jgi:hypothetical protein
MTTFTDVFGGSTVQPGDVSLRVVDLAAATIFGWPAFATSSNVLPRVLELRSAAIGATLTLPDARLASVGQDLTVVNRSAQTVQILNAAGSVVLSVVAGAAHYLYLTDTTTSAGGWRALAFGTAPNQVDATALAGAGLVARNGALDQAAPVTTFASSRAVTTADRGKVLVWNGASGTLTLLSAGLASEFFFELRNDGNGALTIAAAPGDLIDGGVAIALQPSESCFVHTAATLGGSLTVGRGRNANFAFTQLVKNVTGGALSLSLSEATNVVQTFTGALTAAQIIAVPAVVQVYYINNRTTGAFPLTVRASPTGLAVTVPTSQSAILLSDGVDVTNAATTTAGLAALQFGAGSAGAPSVAVGQPNAGLFLAGSDTLGVAVAGASAMELSPGLVTMRHPGTQTLTVSSSTSGDVELVLDAAARKSRSLRYRTAGVNRWALETSTAAEGGSGSGADLLLNRYSDVGGLIDTVATFSRVTGSVTFSGALIGPNGFSSSSVLDKDTTAAQTVASAVTFGGVVTSAGIYANAGSAQWGSFRSSNQVNNFAGFATYSGTPFAFMGADGDAAFTGGTGVNFGIRTVQQLLLRSNLGSGLTIGARLVQDGVTDDGVTALQVGSIRASDGFNSENAVCIIGNVIGGTLNAPSKSGYSIFDQLTAPIAGAPAGISDFGIYESRLKTQWHMQTLHPRSLAGQAASTKRSFYRVTYAPSGASDYTANDWLETFHHKSDATFNTIRATNQPFGSMTGSPTVGNAGGFVAGALDGYNLGYTVAAGVMTATRSSNKCQVVLTVVVPNGVIASFSIDKNLGGGTLAYTVVGNGGPVVLIVDTFFSNLNDQFRVYASCSDNNTTIPYALKIYPVLS